MKEINYEFYKGNENYNDGIVEQELLDYYNGNADIDLSREDIFFYTTSIRENIVNWYPFDKNSTVLEIGAGLGTITGTLCEKAKKVIAVEGSKRRAEILKSRHKNRKNLEIYCANFRDIKFQEKFDIIVLIGVFEYSKIFYDTDNPFDDFLNDIKKLLKKNGKILIAIENRYGIKYWAGLSEDHFKKKFIGLEGYEIGKSAQTFGKEELINMFQRNNLNYFKFYYVFPDYKLPKIIYTDECTPKLSDINNLITYNYYNENYNFSAIKAMRGIIDNKMSSFFANSFLVEVSQTPENFSRVSYVKFQNQRSADYRIMTIIEKNIIKKLPLNKNAIKHLKNLMKTHELLLKNNINCSKIKSDYSIEYVDGQLLSEIIRNYCILKDYDKALNEIYKFIDYLYSISKKVKIKNPYINEIKELWDTANILPLGLFDIHPDNVIKKDGKYIFIDQEWSTEKQIPIEYNIYISLNVLYNTVPELNVKESIYNLFTKYGLTNEKIKIFEKCRYDFFDKNDKLNIENKKIKNLISDKTKEEIIDFEDKYKYLEKLFKESKKELEKLENEYKDTIIKKDKLINDFQIELINSKQENLKVLNDFNQEKEKNNVLLLEYNNVVHSKSWKLTKSLRTLSYYLKVLNSRIKKMIILVLRKIYFLIPMSIKTKRKILNYFEIKLPIIKKIRRCDYNIKLNGGDVYVPNKENDIKFGNVINYINKSIAIHAHIYYIDLLDEFINYFNNMPFKFDLFISIPDDSFIKIIKNASKKIKNLDKLKIRKCKNIGRDISPFFIEFGNDLSDYDYVCHIHTKKSVRTGSEQDGWRKHLMDSVLGSEYVIKNIFYIFEKMNNIGMIYPETYKDMPYWAHSYLQNRDNCYKLCKIFGITMPEEYFDYSVGSFFWTRKNALKKLFDMNLSYKDFGKEEGKNDGTFAHAIERMLPYAVLSSGYKYLVIDIYNDVFKYTGSKNLWQYCCQSLEEIIENLIAHKTVSFDIFDTLVTRKIYNPDFIKDLVEKKLNTKYKININNFKNIRNQAEYNIRLRNDFKGDATIDEIYTEIKNITNLTDEQIKFAEETEKELEIMYCIPRKDVLCIYNKLKKSRIKINLVSDMYLDRNTICKILNNCGYYDWNDLYLSSEIKKRKDNNTMWTYYFKNEVDSIHVGDNEKSDIQAVCDLKHEFVHLMNGTTIFKNTAYGKFLDVKSINLTVSDNIVLGLIINKCMFNSPIRKDFKIIVDNYKDFGYVFFGPLFIKFFMWLENETKKNKNDKLLFLAREGYYFEKLYRDYCKFKHINPIKSEYFLASRRSVSVAALKTIDDVELLFTKYYNGKLKNLFYSRLGLEIDELDEKIELPRDKDKCLDIFRKYSKSYFKNIEEESNEYKTYAQKCMDGFHKIAVVDLGYSGTIQYYLSKLMNNKFDGYYFIVDGNVIAKKFGCNVYSCFNYEHKENYEDNILYDSLILESFLTAPFGQLLKFKNGNPIYKNDVISDIEFKNLNDIYLGVSSFLNDFINLNPNCSVDEISNILVCKNFSSLIMVNEILSSSLENGFKLEDKYCSDETSNVFKLLKDRLK